MTVPDPNYPKMRSYFVIPVKGSEFGVIAIARNRNDSKTLGSHYWDSMGIDWEWTEIRSKLSTGDMSGLTTPQILEVKNSLYRGFFDYIMDICDICEEFDESLTLINGKATCPSCEEVIQ